MMKPNPSHGTLRRPSRALAILLTTGWLSFVASPSAEAAPSAVLPAADGSMPTAIAAAPADTLRRVALEEVEVPATRNLSPSHAATPTQRLRHDDLERMGAQSVGDAVRHLAGVGVKDYGGLGGMKTISVRGLSAAHTAVCYDGVVVGNCQSGQVDLGRFPVTLLQAVTLTVGHDEDLSASARSLAAGSMLALSSMAADGQSSVALQGGSFGSFHPTVTLTTAGERTRAGITVDALRMDGRYPFTLVNGSVVTDERRQNNDLRRILAEGSLDHDFLSGATLRTKFHYDASERGIPGSVIFYNPASQQRLRDRSAFVQGVLTRRWEQLTLTTRAKYQYSWDYYTDTDVKYEGGRQVDDNTQHEGYLQSTLSWQVSDRLQLAWAEDGVLGTLSSNLPSCPFPTRLTFYSSLQGRYATPRFTLHGTLLSTQATEHVKVGTQPDDRHKVTPSLSVAVQPWQRMPLRVRMLYKETYRLPAFNDLYYLRSGNRALRPEWAREVGAGLTWQHAGNGSWCPVLLVTVDGYRNDVRDKIVAFPTTYVWKMANYGRVDIRGIDVHTSATLQPTPLVGLHATLAYSYQRAHDVTDAASSTYGHQLPYTPLHSGSALAGVSYGRWEVDYSLVAASSRQSMMIDSQLYRLAPYAEHSVTASRSFALGGGTLAVRAEALNLGGCAYEIIQYYPMPLRQYRATLSYQF